MLEPWIIEEIRRREEERNRERESRVLELPLYDERRSDDERPATNDNEEKPSRGVVVMDM